MTEKHTTKHHEPSMGTPEAVKEASASDAKQSQPQRWTMSEAALFMRERRKKHMTASNAD